MDIDTLKQFVADVWNCDVSQVSATLHVFEDAWSCQFGVLAEQLFADGWQGDGFIGNFLTRNSLVLNNNGSRLFMVVSYLQNFYGSGEYRARMMRMGSPIGRLGEPCRAKDGQVVMVNNTDGVLFDTLKIERRVTIVLPSGVDEGSVDVPRFVRTNTGGYMQIKYIEFFRNS